MKKFYFFLTAILFAAVSFAQQPILPLDFESTTLNYTFTDFGGGGTVKISNPQVSAGNNSANVARMIKSSGEVYGGSFISLAAPIDFSVNKTFKVKVFSPRVGARLLLKVENETNGAINFEREAITTVANDWEDLTFNYNAISTSNQYQKLVFIFDNGTTGDGSANFTFLFDDIRLITNGGSGLTQMSLPVTFDDVTVDYGLLGFGGAEQSTVVVDPTLATNKVAKVIRTNTAETYAGTTITAAAELGFSGVIPFTASATKMNVRVWSPDAGIQVRLKVEDKNDGTHSVETEATVTVASGWQTLEFDFANQATGTAALNLGFTYNKASIFFNFGVTGAVAGERTYYFDDVQFGGAGSGGLAQMDLPVTFEGTAIEYGLVGFGGAEQSTIVVDPTLATNTVAKVIKTNTAELWAGTTITAVTGGLQTGFISNIPFTATATKMNVRVWSPDAGIQVRLKVEDKNDGTHSVETEATVTTASGWQTLEFNFANQATGTAALNLGFTYNKASIFFNFGVTGAVAGERTYYFDDVQFGGAGSGGLAQMDLPVTFEGTAIEYGLVGFGGAEQSTIVVDPTLATNTAAKVIKTNTAELWAGTTITAVTGGLQTGFISNIPFTSTATKMNVRVWSPDAGIQVRLKVEDRNDGTHSVETEATVTTASGWQTLEFNFANQATGTAALNLGFTYNKASIFFNFGVTGAVAGERTYYFDDVQFGGLANPTLPPAPAVAPAIAYCQNAVASVLSATALPGNSLLWYTVSTGGTGSTTAPVPSTTAVGTTNYYVSQVNATLLEGPRALISVTVSALPLAPAVTAAVGYCQNALATALTAAADAGFTLNWYDVAVGGTPVTLAPTPSTNTVGTTTYFVSQQNATGCESPRAAITVTVSGQLSVPVITAAPHTRLFPGLTTTNIATVTPTGSADVYTWFKNGIIIPGEIDDNINVTVDGLGTYKLLITNSTGCESVSNEVTISDSSNSRLFVYSNPSAGRFQVRYFSDINDLSPKTIVVYDAKGALVYKAKYIIFGAYTAMQIDLSNRMAGVYFVNLFDNNGKRLATERVSVVR